MAYRLATATRNTATDAVTGALNLTGTSSAATIQFRTGAQPTNVGDAAAGTLLGTLTFSNTAFGASSTGTATANSIASDTNADNSGTVAHARVLDGHGNIHSDMDAAQGSGTANFDNATIVSGGTIAISSFTITTPIS